MQPTRDVTTYVAGWRRRNAEREAHARARAAEALARLPAVVEVLVQRFGARRVVLFGSLATGRFSDASDIDLAVEGIRDRWFEAWEAAERRLAPEFRLDLLPLELARPAIRAAIASGRVLHGDG